MDSLCCGRTRAYCSRLEMDLTVSVLHHGYEQEGARAACLFQLLVQKVVGVSAGGSISRHIQWCGQMQTSCIHFGNGEYLVLGHGNEGSDDEEYFVPTVVEAFAGKKVVRAAAWECTQ